jgi:predicted ATPase
VADPLAETAKRQPIVLILEDLHWADPASLDLLRFLARRVASLPLLLLATYRDDEVTRHHPLYRLLPVLVREAEALRLGLRPLDGGDVRELVRSRYQLPEPHEARLVAYLQERAEGNPFFVGELLRDIEEAGLLRQEQEVADWMLGDLVRAGLPTLLRQVLDGRLSRLPEEAQRLISVAAVLGQEVPLTLWRHVAEVSGEAVLAALEVAAEAHLVEETRDGTGAHFVHALTRVAVYAGIPSSQRRRWHRLAGEALAAAVHPDPDAVAHHFRQAGDVRAAGWLVRAGERAQRLYAWETAADRFETALALMEAGGADAREQGWLLYRMARLRRYAAPDQSITALEAAERVARAAQDPVLAPTRCAIAARSAALLEISAVASPNWRPGSRRWMPYPPRGQVPMNRSPSGWPAPSRQRKTSPLLHGMAPAPSIARGAGARSRSGWPGLGASTRPARSVSDWRRLPPSRLQDRGATLWPRVTPTWAWQWRTAAPAGRSKHGMPSGARASCFCRPSTTSAWPTPA